MVPELTVDEELGTVVPELVRANAMKYCEWLLGCGQWKLPVPTTDVSSAEECITEQLFPPLLPIWYRETRLPGLVQVIHRTGPRGRGRARVGGL